MKITTLILILFTLLCIQPSSAQSLDPVRIGIDGLSHDHVHGILNNYQKRSDIQIVGIAESDKKRAKELADRYGFDLSMVYDDLQTMVEKTKPEG